MVELYRLLRELLERNEACATATIVGASGSIPNAVGATMLVGRGGKLLAGTVGGGAIEHQALAECGAAIAEGKHRSFTYHLTDAEAGGIGMMCGGKAQLFVQVHTPQPQLVLVGAGHIHLELARFVRGLDYRVTVIDDRMEWANAENYPGAEVLNLSPEEAYPRVAWSESSYLVIATRDRDTPALRAAVGLPCRYVGVVASRRKALTILRQLEGEGIDLGPLLPRLYAPVGLALGGRSPAEIALSILAELQLVRHGQAGGHLRVTAEQLARLKRPRLAGEGG
ncbi:MAG: XdhC family protein [Deltaproteobacteria bacterium]|nr:XdhC family protein [Deltaproteobacteria bacterium]